MTGRKTEDSETGKDRTGGKAPMDNAGEAALPRLRTLGDTGTVQHEASSSREGTVPRKARYADDASSMVFFAGDDDEWDGEDNDWDDEDDDLDYWEIVDGVPQDLAEASMLAWFDIADHLGKTAWWLTPESITILELSKEELETLGGMDVIDAFRERLASDLQRLGIRRAPSSLPKDLWLVMVRLYMIRKWKEETHQENKEPKLDPMLLDSILENWVMRYIKDHHMGQLKVMAALLFDMCAEEGKDFPYEGVLLRRRYNFKGVKIGGPGKKSSKKKQPAASPAPGKDAGEASGWASGESSGKASGGSSGESTSGPSGARRDSSSPWSLDLLNKFLDKIFNGSSDAPGEKDRQPVSGTLAEKPDVASKKAAQKKAVSKDVAQKDAAQSNAHAPGSSVKEPEPKTEVQKTETQKTETQKTEVQKAEAKKTEAKKTEAKKTEVQKAEAPKAKVQKSEVQKAGAQKTEASRQAAGEADKPAEKPARKPRTPFVPTITPPFDPEHPTAEGIQELFRLSSCAEYEFAYKVGVGKLTAQRWLEARGSIYLTKDSLKKVSRYQLKLLKKIAGVK